MRLIPGQYAPVRVFVGEQSGALLIPKSALVESQTGNQVYVVGAGDKVQSRRVEVSGVHQGQWVVAKGLKKGERVVVEGTQKVRDGILVELQEAGAPKGGNTLISRFCTNGSVQ